MENRHQILVIVLNYNRENDTQLCLNSLLKQDYRNFEILLIDNNSDNFGDLKSLYQDNSRITILENSTNLGFAKAHNAGLSHLKDDLDRYAYVALLNNDAVANQDWLSAMVDCAQSNHADLVASKIIKIASGGRLDNIGHSMLNTGEIVPLGFNEDESNFCNETENLGPSGAGALYSVRLIKNIGFFDPFFDTGYEDAELGVRAVICGYKSFYCPQAIVHHKVSQSVRLVDNLQYRIRQQFNIYYSYFKLMPSGVIAINFPFILIKYLAVILVEFVLLKWTYIKIHFATIAQLWKERAFIAEQRERFQSGVKLIPGIKILRLQQFFLFYDIKRLIKVVFGKQKTVFDNSMSSPQNSIS